MKKIYLLLLAAVSPLFYGQLFAQQYNVFIDSARIAIDAGNCDAASRNLNKVPPAARQQADYLLAMGRTQDCMKNYEQALYYYNKYLAVRTEDDSVKRRTAELNDEKNRLARANNEPENAKKIYQVATKSKKRRQRNLVDDYNLIGIAYGTGVSKEQFPFSGHVVIPMSFAFMKLRDRATLDFSSVTSLMTKTNHLWAERALQLPKGTIGTDNPKLGFSEVVTMGFCPVLVNKRNIALTAGVFGGFNYFLIPGIDFEIHSAEVSSKWASCYGIKVSLFLGEHFAAFANLVLTSARTASVLPIRGDEYKVATNFNTINIGIASRTDTWW